MKRRLSLLAVAATVAATIGATGALAAAGSAGSGSGLPTLKITVTGTKGISVSGSAVTGAIKVLTKVSGQPPANGANVAIVRLYPGRTIAQAAGAVQAHHGDINYLAPYGTLFYDASAPGATETVFPVPGHYVALNVSGNGPGGFASFTVTKSSSPAALPKAAATEKAIDFSFRGPTVLHHGTLVRTQNAGDEAHMVILVGARNKRAAHKLLAGLRAGKSQKSLRPYLTGQFVGLLGDASPGALQQAVLKIKPGYYAQVCFMNTQDGREHAQLGMARLVRVVK